MEGWAGLGGWLRIETVYLPEGSRTNPTTKLTGLNVEQLRWTGQRVTATLNRHRHLG